MKKSFFAMLLFMLSGLLFAQAPQWLWANRAGGLMEDRATGIVADDAGNNYITGYIKSTSDFGAAILYTSGASDGFAAKLNEEGNWIWVQQVYGSVEDRCNSIALDSAGNSYVTGCFQVSAGFGSTSLTGYGSTDVFIAKLDPNGNWLWAKQAGGTGSDDGISIAVDDSGNVCVAGTFNGSSSFGSTNLTSMGGKDIFIAKLDTNGNWLWAKSAGSTSDDVISGIAADGLYHCQITGHFSGSISFGTTTLASSGTDGYIARLDAGGNWLWAGQTGGTGSEYCSSIAADNAGNAYLTGRFAGTSEFGSTILSSEMNYNVFVAKLGADGNWLWANQSFGGYGMGYGNLGYCVSLDSRGNIYLTGSFTYTADFGGYVLTSAYTMTPNLFAAKLDGSGNWMWAQQAGGNGPDIGYSIAVDDLGMSYVTGSFGNPAVFGDTTLTSVGDLDIFVAKLSSPPPPPLALPFLEDWSSGSLDTNHWATECSYWQISETLGNPFPSVVFLSSDDFVSYDFSLTSHEFDGTGMPSVKLKFDIDFEYSDWLGDNVLILEICNDSIWTPIGTYAYYTVDSLTTFFMDISSFAVGNIFRIRFRADGSAAENFSYWMIDNIRLEEIPAQMDAPQNLTITRSGNYLCLDWDPVPAADWYALYFAPYPDGPFYLGACFSAAITHLEGELTSEMDPMLFFRLTAGAGATPSREPVAGQSCRPLLNFKRVGE